MIISHQNYYSQEANISYMSVSQFKSFVSCEAAAMAEIQGTYAAPTTTAMLVGSYVDAWFEGTLGIFKEQHPEIFKRDGELKADYIQADRIIQRVSRDRLFMEYMNGEKQKIFTADLFGTPWKIKIDSWFPNRIVDLKIVRTLAPIMGKSFIEYWGYDIQGAIYQAVEGTRKPFYIAAATKEDPPDLEVIHIPDYILEEALSFVKRHIPRILAVKKGDVPPARCGRPSCPYCRATKKLVAPIEMENVGYSIKQLNEMKGEYEQWRILY